MKKENRECGSCTKCCEGWLTGEVYGYKFWPGNPCHFKMNGGCSIYENRPHDPCKTYKCQWLINDKIPYWMKPNEINAIITEKKVEDISYFDVAEAGSVLRSDVLSWLIMHCLNEKLNILYRINGGTNRIGSKEFLELKL